MRRVLTAGQMVSGGETVRDAWVLVEDGVIAGVGSRAGGELPGDAERRDFPEGVLAPAFVDVHAHGAAGHDVMEGTPEALSRVGRFLGSRGVGAYLPTTMTAGVEATLRALEGIAGFMERSGEEGAAVPIGIHMEGPFLSHARRGVHPAELLQTPSVALFERFWEAARGRVRLMTVAPETPGALELIAYATAKGVRVSLGHSDATAAEARAGIEAGARSATHTFNAMRPLDHREPGILGTVLDAGELYAELICDGVHVDPAVVRLFWKAKGGARAVLVTDGISATGMPEGRYRLAGLEVEVKDGRCMREGVLAGSVLTMDRAVRNFAEFTGAGWGAAVRAGSGNPAEMIGEGDRWGRVEVGRRAAMVVLGGSGEVVGTVLGESFRGI
jgi:N-acetylglucosamine-6-phosphate deacetylase